MSLAKKPLKKRRTTWLINSLITGSVVIGMMGLARLSPTIAWAFAATGLFGLVVFFYMAGRSER